MRRVWPFQSPTSSSAASLALKGWLASASRLILKYRRPIVGVVGLAMIGLELQEHVVQQMYDLLSLAVLLHVVSVVIMAVLMELLVQYDRQRAASVEIIDRKHKLSRQLSLCEDWRSLTQSIAAIPGAVAEAEQAALLLASPSAQHFELIARWSAEDRASTGRFRLSEGACDHLPGEHPGDLHPFQSDATGLPADHGPASPAAYCLPIAYGRTVLALLRFSLKPGQQLHPQQAAVLISLADDIAVALKTGLNSRSLEELKIAEATVHERRRITRDLHDHLGQNLSYLHLKLDQLTSPEVAPPPPELPAELVKMRGVAEESYLIVRNMLETMSAHSTQNLGDLLRQHGVAVGRRANFEFVLTGHGQPQTLPPATQQQLFFVFREALNNVEKHACASQVDVSLEWSPCRLALTIADDGCGLSPSAAASRVHLGLNIIRERVAEMDGQVEFASPPGQGTIVSISIPLTPVTVAHEPS